MKGINFEKLALPIISCLKFKACYWSYIRVKKSFGTWWFKTGGLSLIVCSVPALEVGGEVCPPWVELAQLVGKNDVWPVAWEGNLHLLKSFKIGTGVISLAGVYDGDEKGSKDKAGGQNCHEKCRRGNFLTTCLPTSSHLWLIFLCDSIS